MTAPTSDPQTPDGPEPHAPPLWGWLWLHPGAAVDQMAAGLAVWRRMAEASLTFWIGRTPGA